MAPEISNQPKIVPTRETPLTLVPSTAVSSVAKNAVVDPNSAGAWALVSGVYKAVDSLTKGQSDLLSSLNRRADLEKEKFGLFSLVVESIPAKIFFAAFHNFDTEGARDIVRRTRQMLGIASE